MSKLHTIDADVLVIGAGVMGSSLAMHLSAFGHKVHVADLDLGGVYSSSELNAGGVRATWGQKLNIEVSKASIEYFDSVRDEVGYRDCGYLWLLRPDRWEAALRARELQLSLGWEVQAWTPQEIEFKRPFIDKVDDLAGAIFAPRDGLINPNLLKNHFRSVATQSGQCVFDDRTWVDAVDWNPGSCRWSVRASRYSGPLDDESKREKLVSGTGLLNPAHSVEYRVRYIVNAAGPWARRVAATLGYQSPAYPVRRQVCIFDARGVDLTPYGMMIDPSGVYFHPEASNVLAGFADHDQPAGENFEYEGEVFFQERIWPALYERSTALEELKHLTGWAGLYEVSPDESAILGEVTKSKSGDRGMGLFEIHSFSGHGVMQSYAAARALAELMTHGAYTTLDLSGWSAERFVTGKLLHETVVI